MKLPELNQLIIGVHKSGHEFKGVVARTYEANFRTGNLVFYRDVVGHELVLRLDQGDRWRDPTVVVTPRTIPAWRTAEHMGANQPCYSCWTHTGNISILRAVSSVEGIHCATCDNYAVYKCPGRGCYYRCDDCKRDNYWRTHRGRFPEVEIAVPV
jgi:hypothetical protein